MQLTALHKRVFFSSFLVSHFAIYDCYIIVFFFWLSVLELALFPCDLACKKSFWKFELKKKKLYSSFLGISHIQEPPYLYIIFFSCFLLLIDEVGC